MMRKKKFYIYKLNVKTFSTSSRLLVEEDISVLLGRINSKTLALQSMNNSAKEGESKLKESREYMNNITNQLIFLKKKSLREGKDMTTYLDHFTKFIGKEDTIKTDELLAKSKQMEELFNQKITDESQSDNSSIIKLIKLMKTKEKLIHDAEDKVETLINKSIEKGISKGERDLPFQVQYLAARALRLKERKEFKEEENKVFSESTSRLSAVDYVVDIMETEMPSYTEPED